MKKASLLLALLPFQLFAQFRIGGNLENIAIYADGTGYKAAVTDNLRLKLDIEYKAPEWRLFGDLRLNLYYGYGAAVGASPNGFLYGGGANGHNYALGLEIPRLYFRGYSRAGNFTLGRSYLTFGQPQLFNALEWHKNFDLLDPAGTKPGVNMLAWDLGLGSYGKIKAFVGGDDRWLSPLGGLEIVVGVPRFEMNLAYQYKGDDRNVFGLGLKADLVLTFFATYAAHLQQITSGKGFSQFHDFSMGFDYSFPLNTSSLLVRQIFYYNSAGAVSAAGLLTARGGDYYFAALGYSYSTLEFTINEFASLGADVLVSLLDGSGAVMPRGSFSLANNLKLDVLMAVFFGSAESEFGPKKDILPNVSLRASLKASF